MCCITTQRSPLSHDTMFCIATPPSQAMHARVLLNALLAGRSCRGLYHGPTKSCRGRGLAISWPLQLCPAALCHDTIHCIVTQMGSSLSSCLLSIFFFFTSIFFSYSSYWKTTKKNIFFYFPVEQPVLYTVKPQKKISLIHFYIFFLCAIHQAHNSHNTYTTIHVMHTITHQSSKCTKNA